MPCTDHFGAPVLSQYVHTHMHKDQNARLESSHRALVQDSPDAANYIDAWGLLEFQVDPGPLLSFLVIHKNDT